VFELQAADGVVPIRLAKVEPVGNSGRPGGAFSLLFASANGRGCRRRSIRCGIRRSV